jgi:hypothetical protein
MTSVYFPSARRSKVENNALTEKNIPATNQTPPVVMPIRGTNSKPMPPHNPKTEEASK